MLKEYRNYVHPEKELRHGIKLEFNDSSMFWQVTKELARQLLLSTARRRANTVTRGSRIYDSEGSPAKWEDEPAAGVVAAIAGPRGRLRS